MRKTSSILLASLIATLLAVENCSALAQLDWPTARKESWNIVAFSDSKLHKLVTFDLPSSGCSVGKKGYYTQGAVVTENNYVFSYFCDDSADNNYVIFANRSTGKVIKKIKGNWGHMNSIYYQWGTGQVRIRSSSADEDGCFTDGNTDSDIKKVKISKCKTARQKDWGTPGVNVNGKSVSSTSSSQGRLTSQGEAVYGKYSYTVGWDSASNNWGQQWYKKKGLNALFIFDNDAKKLIKTFYLPSPVGECEDVSLDGDGNVYLWYNYGRGKTGVMYRINQSDLGLPKEAEPQKTTGNSESSSSQSTDNSSASSSAQKTDSNSTPSNTQKTEDNSASSNTSQANDSPASNNTSKTSDDSSTSNSRQTNDNSTSNSSQKTNDSTSNNSRNTNETSTPGSSRQSNTNPGPSSSRQSNTNPELSSPEQSNRSGTNSSEATNDSRFNGYINRSSWTDVLWNNASTVSIFSRPNSPSSSDSPRSLNGINTTANIPTQRTTREDKSNSAAQSTPQTTIPIISIERILNAIVGWNNFNDSEEETIVVNSGF